jgi:serine/threonine protein kinase
MTRWHQDIKPTNILVSGDVGNNPYEVRFMLADLGLSHFTAVVEDRAGVTGEDTHGARAYSIEPL